MGSLPPAARCHTVGLVDGGPEVDLRGSRLILVWPILFFSFVVWVMFFSGSSGSSHRSRTPNVGGTVFVVMLFVVIPLLFVVAMARAGARSRGPVLQLRTGLITRRLPAEEISGFVLVDRIGRRADRGLCHLAVALMPGSNADLADRWAKAAPFLRLIRQIGYRLSNRQPQDIPMTFVSFERMDDALDQLERWHRWALIADVHLPTRE